MLAQTDSWSNAVLSLFPAISGAGIGMWRRFGYSVSTHLLTSAYTKGRFRVPAVVNSVRQVWESIIHSIQ